MKCANNGGHRGESAHLHTLALEGHVWVITERGWPFADLRFCCIQCAESFVSRIPGGWELWCESFRRGLNGNGHLYIHELKMRKIVVRGALFRHPELPGIFDDAFTHL